MQNKKEFYENHWKINNLPDKSNHPYQKKNPDIEVKKFMNYVRIKIPEGDVLDIGCGAGRHSILFAKHGYNVKGIDISKNAINFAKSWAKQENLNINFEITSIFDFKPEKKYDIIIDYGLLHHLPKKYWKKYKNVLSNSSKKGTALFLFVFSNDTKEFAGKKVKKDQEIINGEYFHFFTEKKIKDLFQEFKILKKIKKKSIDKKSSYFAFYLEKQII